MQVGITNQTPSQQSDNISPSIPSTIAADEQRTPWPTSSIEQRDSSPKDLTSPDTVVTSTRGDATSSPSSRQNQSIENIPSIIPSAIVGASSVAREYDQSSLIIYSSTNSTLALQFFFFF